MRLAIDDEIVAYMPRCEPSVNSVTKTRTSIYSAASASISRASMPEAMMIEPVAPTVPVPPERVWVEVTAELSGFGPGVNWARTAGARSAARQRQERMRERRCMKLKRNRGRW